MANIKITDLTAYTDPAATDVLPIVDVGADVTKKISIQDLLENAGSGTAAAPGIAFDGDSDTGIYRPGANQVAISTNGAQALYINADGDILVADGNRMEIDEVRARNGAGLKLFDDAGVGIFVQDGGAVGIGSSSPLFLTDILSGTANTGANVNNPSQLSVTGPNKGLITGGATVFINSNSDLAADTGGSIAFSGRNTTSSTNSSVHAVIKGAKENATSANNNGYLAVAVQSHSAGALVEWMRINSSGNVGIGTNNPANKLVVSETNSNKALEISPGATTTLLSYNRTGNTYIPIRTRANTHTFSDGSSDFVHIDSSGRLLVGTTSDSGGALLQVNGDRVRIATAKTPASASDTGTAGEVCWDTSYIYVCTATDTWKRAALSTW